jgi:hypothetical protein
LVGADRGDGHQPCLRHVIVQHEPDITSPPDHRIRGGRLESDEENLG